MDHIPLLVAAYQVLRTWSLWNLLMRDETIFFRRLVNGELERQSGGLLSVTLHNVFYVIYAIRNS